MAYQCNSHANIGIDIDRPSDMDDGRLARPIEIKPKRRNAGATSRGKAQNQIGLMIYEIRNQLGGRVIDKKTMDRGGLNLFNGWIIPVSNQPHCFDKFLTLIGNQVSPRPTV
jgi:hypothetical protein